jgi:hypothetical protein
MRTLNKEYILKTLSEEKLWKVGESDTFIHEMSSTWTVTLRKEEEVYKPFMYSVNAKKNGTNETFGRRYTSMEKAFLHILNNFNENVNIRNRYETLSDALNVIK